MESSLSEAEVDLIVYDKLKEKGWLEITVKFPSKCLECKEQIKKDEKALWQKDVGVKHTLGTWCNKMPILKEGEEVSQ